MQRHGVDSVGNYMEMVTMLQGYWDIASRRLVDNVCMLVDKDFVDHVLSELDTQLTVYSMGLSKNEVKDVMKEDRYIVQRRKQLLEKIKLVQGAIEILQEKLG
ncbi:hypothetical protein EON65_16205 [archaeon]|nr:MAG: hypothetical protein EON65_16205 [archaeon]